MKTKMRLLAVISMLLSIVLLVEVPVAALATVVENNEETNITFADSDAFVSDENMEGNIVGELEDKRTEYTKTFMMDNGSCMVAQYEVPVHYKNEKGKWVDYNNALDTKDSDSKADESTVDEALVDEELDNKSSDIDVKLSKKSKVNNMVKVSSNDYSISWGYDDAEKVEAKVIDNYEKLSGNDKYTTLSNLSSEVIYENVFENVDLQYFVTSTGVKENIILKKSDVPNEFNITYKVNKLTAKQTDDYCITLYDKAGKEVYNILAPYMVDAKGKTSTKLKLEMVSQKGANLKVKLSLDKSFIRTLWRAFPITVDPELTTTLNNKIDLYACANGTAVNYGPYSISKDSFAIVSFKELPELADGERIISAKLNLEAANGSTVFGEEDTEPVVIKAHRLQTGSDTTYTYDNEVLDYDSLSYEDNTNLEFDITRLFKEWYNNGDETDTIAFEAEDTIGSRSIHIQQPAKTNNKPSLTYIYKDFTGTEGDLSYHTFSAGHNATVSVSDYLGNLVLTQTIFESTGSRMPFSVYLIYNSINYDKKFENGSPSGLGWQFSFNQYIRETTGVLAEQGYNYIYTDSDGTDHYLKRDSDNEEWYDESGIGITLTKDDTNLYIDSGSVVQTYELPTAGGKLLTEKDEYDNTITYNYTDGNLTSVVDGSGRTTTIYYNTNSSNESRISKIKSPDNKYLYFYYTSDDKIDYVQFSNAMVTRFVYGDNNRVVTVKDEYIAPPTPGLMMSFGYDSNARVNKITELGTDGSEGNYLDIAYNDDNTTVFTDRKGRSVTYTFNDSGNLISTLNSNGYVSGGNISGLSLSGGAESFTKNYITQSTEFEAIGDTDNSYYYKIDGTKDELTSTGGVCSIDTSDSSGENGQVQFIGSSSLKISNSANTSNSAFFTTIVHKESASGFAGKDITFSAYVKTKDVVQIYSGGSVGAALRIVSYDSDGNAIEGTHSSSIGIIGTEDWQRLSITSDIPENADDIKLFCMLRYASGTAWFDCLQLEIGNTASDFNALQNSDFSSNNSWKTNEEKAISVQNGTVTLEGIPEVYNNAFEDDEADTSTSDETLIAETYTQEVTETEPYGWVTTYDDYGNEIKTEQGFVTRTVKKTYEVVSDKDIADTGSSTDDTEQSALGNSYIYQTVDIGRLGVIFNIAGEAQANSVPLTNENRTFGIALVVHYDDTTISPEMHYQEFNACTDSKQTVSMSVYPYEDSKVIDYVDFAFVYSYNVNEMVISNSMLNIALSSYSTVEDTEEETGSTEEDEDNYIDYEVLSETVDKTQTYMQTSSSYNSTGNYVTSETDEAGNTVTYTYDAMGNVTSITDGEENTTSYEYNADGNITKISSGDASNTYSYKVGGKVASIKHNNFNYTFNYDVFDNIISSKIGSVTVSSNTYSAYNGNLIKTSFANGDYIEYTYDEYDNISKMVSENGTIAEFVYNKKGLVSKYIDSMNNTTTYYYYDFNGSVTGEYRQSDSGALSYYLSYDSNGNPVEKTSVNGQTKIITSGTDSEGNMFTSYDGITVDSTSDDFGRTTKVETSKSGEDNSFVTEYEYASGAEENSTTNLVSKITQKYADGELVNYEYTYNANGDITMVYENGVKVAVYNYDELNQLTWYGDRNTGLYKLFEYDNAGNILNVKEYNLQSNGWYPSSLIKEYTYSYGDTNWKDKLTTFDGDNITYDANGNPLNYRDGITFTWVNGRTLNSITKGNATIAMKYDSNGMRTQKGNIKYYYDSSNELIGMVSGDNTLLFYYDEDDTPTSFTHNGTMYYYVKNWFGDIVKIVDQNGTVVANYTYDALGKKLDITNSSGTTITSDSSVALLNPLRYRGYIYDDETGLYYLQSRYYDPTIGRFVNADVYCDTLSGEPLSTNMFSYCNNNSVNQLDPNGKDAYWLQDYDNVSNLGHTSLLIQESPGNWWYFYWGDKDIQLLYFGKGSLRDLNTYLHGYRNGKKRYINPWGYNFYRGNNYDSWKKIKGNFVKCLDYIFYTLMGHKRRNEPVVRSYSMKYKNSKYENTSYKLYTNNCVLVSLRVLLRGTFTGKSMENIDRYKRNIIYTLLWDTAVANSVPNYVYTYLSVSGFFLQ